MTDEHFDVVVIGSGFGGSVAACRAAENDHTVLVLERGRTYRPGDFPRTPLGMSTNIWDPSEGLFGLFQVWSFRHLDAVVASGVGGGSLIYANVVLPMPEEWFAAQGSRWPIAYDDIAAHYPTVEKMLGAEVLPEHLDGHVPKSKVFTDAAEAAGMTVERAPLAVTFSLPGKPLGDLFGSIDNMHGVQRRTCRLCGECDLGCNDGAKNSLDMTYLSRATSADRQVPAEVRPLSEVKRITAAEDGYDVDYVVHRPPEPVWARSPRPAGERARHHRVHATKVVVAAGAFGSTRLLLANRAGLPGLSRTLGTRFSGNGDALGFLAGPAETVVESSAGPVITSYARRRDGSHFLQDGGQPAFAAWIATALQGSVYGRGVQLVARRWLKRLRNDIDTEAGADLADVLGASRTARSTLPLLGMGMDGGTGSMSLDDEGRLTLDWSAARSAGYYDEVRSSMTELARGSDSRFRKGPSDWLSRNLSAHPLGGAPMGVDAGHGVVDAYGEVFGHPGLFVTDGSVLPSAAGANPSMTIAALAERFSTRIAERTSG